MTRVTVSDRDQLISRSIISCWFGMITSLRSKSVRVVERMRILLTVPEMVPMVTVSPIRTGRSNSMMMPEMKLETICCMPKPIPTERPAASHCSFSHWTPSMARAVSEPIPIST
ncbi:hypothetical protein D3C76_1367860 [compost metagenome]